MLASHTVNEKRRKSEEEHYREHIQPEDSVSTKCLFFLDFGQMPVASRDSIQFHMIL